MGRFFRACYARTSQHPVRSVGCVRNGSREPLLYAYLDCSIDASFVWLILRKRLFPLKHASLSVPPSFRESFSSPHSTEHVCLHQFFLSNVPVFPYSPHRGSARGISLSLLSLISSSKDFTSQQKPSIPLQGERKGEDRFYRNHFKRIRTLSTTVTAPTPINQQDTSGT